MGMQSKRPDVTDAILINSITLKGKHIYETQSFFSAFKQMKICFPFSILPGLPVLSVWLAFGYSNGTYFQF